MDWISVKDRLPERRGLEDDETEYVLVALPYRYSDKYHITVCGYDKDGWSMWDGFGMHGDDCERITHWRPMPEGPEESDG